MAGQNIGKIYILIKQTHSLFFSSFCGVSIYKFIRYPSSQASADPTSDIYIEVYSFSTCFDYTVLQKIGEKDTLKMAHPHRTNILSTLPTGILPNEMSSSKLAFD